MKPSRLLLLFSALAVLSLPALRAVDGPAGPTPAPAPLTAATQPGGRGPSAGPQTAAPGANPDSAPNAAPAASATPEDPAPALPPLPPLSIGHGHSGDDDVGVGGSVVVGPGETLSGDAVAVLGSVTVEGRVTGDAVSVLGRNTIDGTVHGDCVTVLGSTTLGPLSRVYGDVVCVGGHLERAPGSWVGGRVVQQAPFAARGLSGLGRHPIFHHGFRLGRPLALGAGMGGLWVIHLALLAFYTVLALVFPRPVTRCADTLVRRPVASFLIPILSLLALPLIFVLLLVTIIGIPVALILLPLAVLAAELFGRASVYAWLGRSLLRGKGGAAGSVVAGGVVCLLLYLIPFLGGLIWLLVSTVSFGCVVATLTESNRAGGGPLPGPAAAAGPRSDPSTPSAPATQRATGETPPPSSVPSGRADPSAPPAASSVPPSVFSSPVSAGEALPPAMPQPTTPPVIPQEISAAAAPVSARAPDTRSAPVAPESLVRAGFWHRMGALGLDVLLVGIVVHASGLALLCHRILGHPYDGSGPFLVTLAAYGAILWKLRGSTIGGIICGLHVVRADGLPLDWATALVRALGCFFSLVVAGLGFVWIAFDPDRQSWHDKIAGTVVVRAPKRISLV